MKIIKKVFILSALMLGLFFSPRLLLGEEKYDGKIIKIDQKVLLLSSTETEISANLKISFEKAGKLNNDGLLLHKLEKYAEAELLFKQSLNIYEKILAPEHYNIAIILDNLATLYLDQGKYIEAESLFLRSLKIAEKALGSDHPNVAGFLESLGRLYILQGKYVESEPFLQRALKIHEKALKPDPEALATVLNDLAILYEKQGKYSESESMFKRTLNIYEKTLGSDHPDVATTLYNLASMYLTQEKYSEAEQLFQRALKIRQKVFNFDHPRIANIFDSIGSLYYNRGKYAEAELSYRRALKIYEKVLRPDHKDILQILGSLGNLNYRLGKQSEAESIFKRILKIKEKTLGMDHSDVALSLNDLAMSYYRQGKYAEAESLFQRALNISEKTLGLEHYNVANILDGLAALYCDQGKYIEAESLFLRSLKIAEKALGPDHPNVAGFLESLGRLYILQGKYVESESLLQRALKIHEKALKPDPEALATVLNDLAILYEKQEKYSEAESMFQRTLNIYEKTLGSDHPDVATILYNIGAMYLRQEKYSEAEQLFHRVLKIRKKNLNQDHPHNANIFDCIGWLYYNQGKYSKALLFFKKYFEVSEKTSQLFGDEDFSKIIRENQQVVCKGLLLSIFQLNYTEPIKAKPFFEFAFQSMEYARARTFLDQLQIRNAGLLSNLSIEDCQKEEKVTSKARNIEELKKREMIKPTNEWNKELLTKFEKELGEIRSEKSKLEKEFREKYPKFMEFKKPQITDVSEMKKKVLNSDEIIISYWETENKIFASLLSQSNYKLLSHNNVNGNIKFKIQKLNTIIEKKLDLDLFKNNSFKLYKEIFEPFIKEINVAGIKTIYIISHGSLINFPFEILVTSEKGDNFNELDYLFKKFNVVYIPSSTVLKQIRKYRALHSVNKTKYPLLLFGDPVYTKEQIKIEEKIPVGKTNIALNENIKDTFSALNYLDKSENKLKTRAIQINASDEVSLDPLPYTRYEVEFISDLFYNNKDNKNIYLGANALESHLKKMNKNNELTKYKYLHFACHGILSGEVKGLAESCLALSIYGDSGEDGLLKMSEIFGLKLNADMVTLSACQTGIESDSTISQGISELARAFFFAGTPRLTVTLWNISDEGTSEFMKRYYKNLIDKEKNKTSFIKALNDTRLQMLDTKEYCYPYYWAPFIMVGEWK